MSTSASSAAPIAGRSIPGGAVPGAGPLSTAASDSPIAAGVSDSRVGTSSPSRQTRDLPVELSRFDPLATIVYHADFNRGYCGFTETIGNYEGSLDTILPGMSFRAPQLSNFTMWDTGTAGTMNGTYALKLATRPMAGSVTAATKRLTWRKLGKIRLETFFGIKSEATELVLTEADVRAFGVLFDVQDDSRRALPRLRYWNAENGKVIGQWQIKTDQPARQAIGSSGKTASISHYDPVGYTPVPGGQQLLCHNELPTKMNWHYLSVTFDLRSMRFLEFQCNDRKFQDLPAPFQMKPWPNLRGLLNTIFFVEADVNKRAFLYLDSVLFSWEDV